MDKQTQRARALAARRAMTEAARTEASAQICRRLMRMKEVQNARTVFSYLAVPEEADLSALHQWLTERGCRVAFPVTRPDGIMHAFAPAPPWRFERGLLGIRSPAPEYALQICPEEIDLVLAPCVALTKTAAGSVTAADITTGSCPCAKTPASSARPSRPSGCRKSPAKNWISRWTHS